MDAEVLTYYKCSFSCCGVDTEVFLSLCLFISSLSARLRPSSPFFFISPKLILISASYRSPVGKVTVTPVTLC